MPNTSMTELTRRDILEMRRNLGDPSIGYSSYPELLFGINPRKDRIITERDEVTHKMYFFVRPQLNMSKDNLIKNTNITQLLNKSTTSLDTFIRHTLDPRLYHMKNEIQSDLCDPFNPFIPIMTNDLKTISGWGDMQTPTTTLSGMYGKQHTMIDGSGDQLMSGDLNCTFQNRIGDPITKLIRAYHFAATGEYMGPARPYIDLLLANELDYNTRVYAIIFGTQTNRIKHIGCTGAAGFKNPQYGAKFDKSSDNPSTDNNDTTLSLWYDGLIYDDIKIMNDFNRTVAMFNPDVMSMLTGKSHNLVRVGDHEELRFRSRMIPIINEETSELLWFISRDYI